MGYANGKVTSIMFASERDAARMRRAAKRAGMGPSTFMRNVILKAVEDILGDARCPACGRKHESSEKTAKEQAA